MSWRGKLIAMRRRRYVWDTRPPNLRERIAAGIFLVAFVVAASSHLAGWRLFGDYDRQVMAGLMFLGLILIRFLPTVRRL